MVIITMKVPENNKCHRSLFPAVYFAATAILLLPSYSHGQVQMGQGQMGLGQMGQGQMGQGQMGQRQPVPVQLDRRRIPARHPPPRLP